MRLEAFNSSTAASGNPEPERAEVQKTSVEPDKTFHNKKDFFRKISEGQLNQPEAERKPKPPMTISSLLGGGTNTTRSNERNNEEYENDTLDDVDQLLDDALEESYRSVLEESSHSSMSNPSSMVNPGGKKQNGDPNLVFSDNDFVGHPSMKAPPSEKPPPVPPPIDSSSSNIDEEIDKQEQAIIASLEMEEREHKKYMETQEKFRKIPLPSGSSENKKLSGQLSQISNSLSSNERMMTSSTSQSSVKKISDSKNNMINNANSAMNGNKNNAQHQNKPEQSQIQAKKRSQQQEQKSYNQHWLIQEAEQRRLAGGSIKPHGVSPSMNQQINNQMNMNQQSNGHHPNNMMMMASPVSQGGEIPTSPNHINTQSPVYENSSYVNHQQQ